MEAGFFEAFSIQLVMSPGNVDICLPCQLCIRPVGLRTLVLVLLGK